MEGWSNLAELIQANSKAHRQAHCAFEVLGKMSSSTNTKEMPSPTKNMSSSFTMRATSWEPARRDAVGSAWLNADAQGLNANSEALNANTEALNADTEALNADVKGLNANSKELNDDAEAFNTAPFSGLCL